MGRPSPHEPASAPRRNALVAFFGQIDRIAREHRHPHDQATLAMRADLQRDGLLKPQGNGNAGDATCRHKD